MPKKTGKRRERPSTFERISQLASHWTGTSTAFGVVLLIILVWLLTGPIFGFSDTWQLVINTSTSVITFLMVFLIQRSQNKELLTVQMKLNEIVAAIDGASNRLIDVEHLSEAELEILHKHYHRLAELTAGEEELRRSHSIEEAQVRHERKAAATKS